MRTLRDAQFAFRTLLRAPGFTIVVVLTLAVGIGASAAIFSVVDAVVLRPLAYPDPQQLVRITSELRGFGATDTGVAAAELADYQARTDLFSAVSGVLPVSANATGSGTPERIDVLLVSWNYFAVLGAAPAHGRTFTRDDEAPGVANVAVVGHAFWQRRLNADPLIVGRPMVIDGDAVLVVGVMPAGFRHPGRTAQGDVDVWSPAAFRAPASASAGRGRRRLPGALARLQPGVTLEQAQARLQEYGAAVTAQYPAEYPERNGWRPRVNALHDDVVGGVAAPMFVLFCGVGLLLLVACVNVAHLVLARSTARRQELAVRRALGATGGQLMVQLAIEGAILAAVGGGCGMLVASWVVRGLVALAPARVPRLDAVTLDVTAIVVAAAIALGVTILFGFGPALRRRDTTFAALKDGGPGRSSDGGSARTRSVLVAAEVAMATILLVGAGLLVRTVAGMLDVPLGFQTDDVLTARMTLPRPNDAARAAYLDPARRSTFYREALRRVAAIPGVRHAALSSQIPLGGFNPPLFVEIEGGDTSGAQPVAQDFQVSPGYFETLGVRVLRGRGFTEADRAGSEPVAMVSETAARTLWPGKDPLGGRLRYGPDLPWSTVIGVTADVLNRRLTEGHQPVVYRPVEQASDLSMAVLVRTTGAVPGLGESLAREVRAVDGGVPVHAVRTMGEVIDAAVAQRRFLMRVLVAFGAIATALALLGIYGVMSFSVSQRTREIGIRMAIGARQADVSRMVMRRGLRLTGIGVAGGLAASLGVSRLLASQLFGVRPADAPTMVAVVVLMTIAAIAAAYFPARRAGRVDPIAALRSP